MKKFKEEFSKLNYWLKIVVVLIGAFIAWTVITSIIGLIWFLYFTSRMHAGF